MHKAESSLRYTFCGAGTGHNEDADIVTEDIRTSAVHCKLGALEFLKP